MTRWILAAGAAALALAAPAFADPKGNKGGKGNDDRRGQVTKGERGDKGPRAARGNDGERGRGQVARGRDDDDNRGRGQAARGREDDDRGNARRIADRGRDDDRLRVRDLDDDDRIRIVRRDFGDLSPGRGRGLIAGCPPGLDMKDNGCLPPGQAKRLVGARLPDALAASMLPFAYRNWYRDNDDYMFRAGDGFIYRVDRDNGLVDGLIPLFGDGYYMAGDPWPAPYNFYNVPVQYRSYWSDPYYRFGNGAIYQLDPATSTVQAIVALLAGDLGVGSRLPVGYNAYNVPFAYRDRYYDTPTAWYRYNDGYIYRVDPTTRLITAVVDALV